MPNRQRLALLLGHVDIGISDAVEHIRDHEAVIEPF
jgi:hypothetical protein